MVGGTVHQMRYFGIPRRFQIYRGVRLPSVLQEKMKGDPEPGTRIMENPLAGSRKRRETSAQTADKHIFR
jgi:hypothetical protein